MITADAALALVKQHRLRLTPETDGWHARSPDGGAEGGRLHRGGRPTPEEAVEAAAATIAETAARKDQYDPGKAIRALQRGRYNIVASNVQVPDPDNPAATHQEKRFEAKKLNGQAISPQPRLTYLEAVDDAEVILGAG